MPPKTPRTPKTPKTPASRPAKRQRVASPEVEDYDWPSWVREEDATLTQPYRQMCARCARDVLEHDGQCNPVMDVLNKKKCKYCNKGKHACEPIPRTMYPRFNHLIYLLEEVTVVACDDPDVFAKRNAVLEQAQCTFNTELTAAQRATKRMGLQEGTPNKRPKSATDFANLQLQQMMQQTEIQARRVRFLGEIAAALTRIAGPFQDGDDGEPEAGVEEDVSVRSFQGVTGGDDGGGYFMSGGLPDEDSEEDGNGSFSGSE